MVLPLKFTAAIGLPSASFAVPFTSAASPASCAAVLISNVLSLVLYQEVSMPPSAPAPTHTSVPFSSFSREMSSSPLFSSSAGCCSSPPSSVFLSSSSLFSLSPLVLVPAWFALSSTMVVPLPSTTSVAKAAGVTSVSVSTRLISRLTTRRDTLLVRFFMCVLLSLLNVSM